MQKLRLIETLLRLLAAVFICAFFSSSAYAQTSEVVAILRAIKTDTQKILETVQIMGITALSWNKPDLTTETASFQAEFNKYGTNLSNTLVMQNNPMLQRSLFIASIPSRPLNPADLELNGLSYSTMLGLPPVPPQPGTEKDFNLDYLKNIAGIGLDHPNPNVGMNGQESDKQKYKAYYNAVTAIQSFDTYVLSGLYADAKANGALTKPQMELLSLATKSDWFAKIASEEMAVVIRQLLMFESQNYVLMTQLVDTEKKMLAAQAMNNTLTIMTGQSAEQLLLQRARTRSAY